MPQNPKLFKSLGNFSLRAFRDEIFQFDYMDEKHQRLIPNISIQHIFYYKDAFSLKNSLKFALFIQLVTANLRLRVPRDEIFQNYCE